MNEKENSEINTFINNLTLVSSDELYLKILLYKLGEKSGFHNGLAINWDDIQAFNESEENYSAKYKIDREKFSIIEKEFSNFISQISEVEKERISKLAEAEKRGTSRLAEIDKSVKVFNPVIKIGYDIEAGKMSLTIDENRLGPFIKDDILNYVSDGNITKAPTGNNENYMLQLKEKRAAKQAVLLSQKSVRVE